MIPTFVQHVPSGTETGTFLALDLGGSNLRTCSVTLLGESRWTMKQQKYSVPSGVKEGEASKVGRRVPPNPLTATALRLHRRESRLVPHADAGAAVGGALESGLHVLVPCRPDRDRLGQIDQLDQGLLVHERGRQRRRDDAAGRAGPQAHPRQGRRARERHGGDADGVSVRGRRLSVRRHLWHGHERRVRRGVGQDHQDGARARPAAGPKGKGLREHGHQHRVGRVRQRAPRPPLHPL